MSEPRIDGHVADCRWHLTTDAECEYRATHLYCPHREHACNCPALPPAESALEQLQRGATGNGARLNAAECQALVGLLAGVSA